MKKLLSILLFIVACSQTPSGEQSRIRRQRLIDALDEAQARMPFTGSATAYIGLTEFYSNRIRYYTSERLFFQPDKLYVYSVQIANGFAPKSENLVGDYDNAVISKVAAQYQLTKTHRNSAIITDEAGNPIDNFQGFNEMYTISPIKIEVSSFEHPQWRENATSTIGFGNKISHFLVKEEYERIYIITLNKDPNIPNQFRTSIDFNNTISFEIAE